MSEATQSALRSLAARWADAAFTYDDSCSDKAETLRECAADIARLISAIRRPALASAAGGMNDERSN